MQPKVVTTCQAAWAVDDAGREYQTGSRPARERMTGAMLVANVLEHVMQVLDNRKEGPMPLGLVRIWQVTIAAALLLGAIVIAATALALR